LRKKILILILLILFSLGHLYPARAQAENLDLVNEIRDILWEHYVEPVPYDLLNKNTVADVIKALKDPYTRYYNEKEFQDFWLSLEGKFGGIGVVIEKIDDKVIVTEVIPDTPAARVNIKNGDILTHVDAKPLTKLSIEEITDIFRGKPGTYLRLKTYRPSTDTFLTYLLTRDYIVIKPLESTILAKNIGYIKLIEFSQEAAREFPKHLNRLKDQGVKGLILDLRNNPGGLIGAVLDISRELLPPGPLVKLFYRGKEPHLISTVGTDDLLPLIVLVNEDSASAAEILAGAIQDRDTGIIVGTTTYGKASVQSLVPLKNGGALKFTSGKYLTPNGRQINKVGLKPDFYIEDPQHQIMEAIWMLEHKVHKSLTFQLNNGTFLVNSFDQKCSVKPYLYNGHFMVPLRSTIESLGGKVKFNPPGSILIILGENIISLKLNSRTFIYNGQNRHFPVKPILKNQHTMVPVRRIAELLGAEVEWRPLTGQVIISR